MTGTFIAVGLMLAFYVWITRPKFLGCRADNNNMKGDSDV